MQDATQAVHPWPLGAEQRPGRHHDQQRQGAEQLEKEAIEGHLRWRHATRDRHVFGNRIHARKDRHGKEHEDNAVHDGGRRLGNGVHGLIP